MTCKQTDVIGKLEYVDGLLFRRCGHKHLNAALLPPAGIKENWPALREKGGLFCLRLFDKEPDKKEKVSHF